MKAVQGVLLSLIKTRINSNSSTFVQIKLRFFNVMILLCFLIAKYFNQYFPLCVESNINQKAKKMHLYK